MPFTPAELWRIKAELGYNLLNVGADAYIGISQLLEQVVNNNIDSEVTTTATTSVTASTTPTPTTITVASATGLATGDRVFVDVDSRLENVTIQNLSGTSLTALFSKAHAGTYPVMLEGPITLAKEALQRIGEVKAEMGTTFGHGALKKVDEVEFYDSSRTHFGSLGDQLSYWRDELASRLGVPNLWRRRSGGSGRLSVY
jgi:hypothetical protein